MHIGSTAYRTVWYEEGCLCLINQPLLPHKLEILRIDNLQDAVKAIASMQVRGAPAIGAAAAFAMVLGRQEGMDPQQAASDIKKARPTAQDLFYGVDSMLEALDKGIEPVQAARAIADKYVESCRMIGRIGSSLIPPGARISTHCNAGWLATVDWGTALAPVFQAHRQGKKPFVWVDETRPRCQGSRLTAYELCQEGIDHAVIADNAMGYFCSRGEVDMVITGSDRIAMNGDIANKIGTYTSALSARAAGIPFYIAAPLATIDKNCQSGKNIPIEERPGEEVSSMFGWCKKTGRMEQVQIAPEGSPVRNPAFDITPAEFISGIITERGIVHPGNIEALF